MARSYHPYKIRTHMVVNSQKREGRTHNHLDISQQDLGFSVPLLDRAWESKVIRIGVKKITGVYSPCDV